MNSTFDKYEWYGETKQNQKHSIQIFKEIEAVGVGGHHIATHSCIMWNEKTKTYTYINITLCHISFFPTLFLP